MPPCQEGRARITAMPLRLQTIPALIAAAFLQSACATSAMASNCTVTGSLGVLPGMDADAICTRFEADLAAALGDRPVPEGLMIALTLHKRGAIAAQMSLAEDGNRVSRYPDFAVEVSDRALAPEDISGLARLAVHVLAGQPNEQTLRSAAQTGGK
jgi:hypothetical protein